ncbi:MAG: hypothetical protein MUE74_02995 [Bacteroidales bacterium]|jgi:tetratricopeptide (TPR) repeat protein|nr:hypothetical protein [Bacteroidales bacterium]
MKRVTILSVRISGATIGIITVLILSITDCYSQTDYLGAGDRNLLLARMSTDRDTAITALKAAILNFNSEIELNPGAARAYAGRGEAKFLLGDYRGAVTDCRDAAELAPQDVKTYIIMGRAEAALGDFRLALREFDKAIDLNPHHTDVYLTYLYRANVKSDTGNDAAAITDYNKSIEVFPSASAYLKRGLAKFNLADRKGACADWGKAKEMGLKEAEDLIRKNCK